MAVLALLLESGRSGLLLPLLSEELGGPLLRAAAFTSGRPSLPALR